METARYATCYVQKCIDSYNRDDESRSDISTLRKREKRQRCSSKVSSLNTYVCLVSCNMCFGWVVIGFNLIINYYHDNL